LSPSRACGVGSIRGGNGAGPGEQEHPLASVCRADVGGADATPERVIPCFGQVAEYTVETSACPPKRGDVLHNEQRWSKYPKATHDVGPQATALAFLDAHAPPGGGDVLTGEPGGEHLDRLHLRPVDGADIAEVRHAGHPCGED